jgi:NAD(P) transhydrogenase subunit alpha
VTAPIRIAVLRERAAGETRVAATPETVRKLVALGAQVAVEAGRAQVRRFPTRSSRRPVRL